MPSDLFRPSGRLGLLPFLAVVVGGGLAIGICFPPGAWFAGLQKPVFQPPNWLFGPVWTLLYVMIAVVGWRLWRRPKAQDQTGALRGLWLAQLGLNFLWSPVFFGLQAPVLALGVIAVLLGVLTSFLSRAWPQARPEALLMLPYLVWVIFATALNGAIVLLN